MRREDSVLGQIAVNGTTKTSLAVDFPTDIVSVEAGCDVIADLPALDVLSHCNDRAPTCPSLGQGSPSGRTDSALLRWAGHGIVYGP